MIYAEILAGGKGTRLGNTEMPKQFLMLGNKPIIIHTVEQFLIHKSINKIIICCIDEWVSHLDNILKKYIGENYKEKIDIVEGGSTRNETIINGCLHIKEHYGLTDEDSIITHDSVRPFISYRIIDENIKAIKEHKAVDTAIEANDTIVETEDSIFIKSIPVRKNYFLGQTPQSFNIVKLMEMYNTLTIDEKEILTDACKMFVIKNEKVAIVKGDYSNMKITTIYDLKLAEAILENGLNHD